MVHRTQPVVPFRRAQIVAFIGLTALVVALLVVCIVKAASWVDRPFAGFLLYKSPDVATFNRRHWPGPGAGLLLRDRILTMNGERVARSRDVVEATARMKPGTPVRYRVLSRGEIREVVIPVAVFTRDDLLVLTVPTMSDGFLFALIGFIVFVLKPFRHVSWAFLGLCYTVAGFGISGFELQSTYLCAELGGLLLAGLPATLVYFALSFPEARSRSIRRLGLLVFVYPAIVFLHRVIFFDNLEAILLHGKLAWLPSYATTTRINAVVTFGAAAFVVGSLFRSARKTASAAVRTRSRTVLLGAFLAFAPGALLIAATEFLHTRISWAWLGIPAAIFPLTIAYAIVTQDLFQANRFTKRAVGYAIVTVLAVGSYVLVLGVASWLFQASDLARSGPFSVGFALVVVLVFTPLHRRIQRAIDRLFDREEYEYRAVLRTLFGIIISGQTVPFGRLIATMIEKMRIESAVLLRPGEPRNTLQPQVVIGLDEEDVGRRARAPQDRLVAALTAKDDLLVRHEVELESESDPRRAELLPFFDRFSAEVIVPVRFQDRLKGVLALGRKKSGRMYTLADLDLLQAVIQQAGHVAGQPAGQVLGKYHLERRIGMGGMAEVFLAWQSGVGGFERRVAVKCPLPHVVENEQLLLMFLDEAQIAAQLQHGNVAQIFEVGRVEQRYFIAMEYVDGPSLRQVIGTLEAASQQMPLTIATGIFLDLLSALEYAHEATGGDGRLLGLVHRDIKPGNLLIDRRGRLKLMDFGIAKATTQIHVTDVGEVRGTLCYMSPEQADGQPVDHRTDIYSAGALLYEMLIGDKACPEGPTGPRLFAVSRVRADVPESIDRVIDRATAPSPIRRHGSAAELRKNLIDALAPVKPALGREIAAWLRDLLPRSSTPGVDARAEFDDSGAGPRRRG